MGEGNKRQLVVRQTDALTTRAEGEPAEILRIRASIEETRARIARSIEDLQVNVEDSLDWRRWARENPWKAVGLGFAVGFYFGS